MVDRKDYETYNQSTRNDIKRIKSIMWEMGQPRGEWARPPGPKDTIHQKEEPDVSDTYARGGPVINSKFSFKKRSKQW